MKKVIELININKKYKLNTNSKDILHNVNMIINEGDFVIIKGKSGSGKSTLLNIIGLIDEYTSGTYLYRGKDVSDFDESKIVFLRNKEIGFVFQQFNLINEFNVYQNVELPLKYGDKINRNERRKRVEERLKDVNMLEKAYYYPYQLSGGQQQRVAIARALINDNNIILADEPTGALDSVNSKEIMNVLCQLNKDGKTIIMVTHNEDFIKYANKVIDIKDGNIILNKN